MTVHGCGHQPEWGLCFTLQGRTGLWALSWALVGSRWNDGVTEGVSLTLPSLPDQSQISLDLLLLLLWTLS